MQRLALPLLLFASLLTFAGCDALGSDDAESVTLRGLSLVELPADLQATMNAGGTVLWEIQDVIGRSYALETSLPARVPAAKNLILVLADAASCTPRCEPAAIVPFESPTQPNGTVVHVEDRGVVADLSFE